MKNHGLCTLEDERAELIERIKQHQALLNDPEITPRNIANSRHIIKDTTRAVAEVDMCIAVLKGELISDPEAFTEYLKAMQESK